MFLVCYSSDKRKIKP